MYGYGYQYSAIINGGGNNPAAAIFGTYKTRVLADGGVVENDACTITFLESIGAGIIPLFDADAQAFFDRVTAASGSLNTTEQDAVNTLVVQMKADGIWDSMKAIYPMVGASAAACSQNLKSSSFTGSFTSGWTFASTGATPNGTSAFMNTNLIPNTSLIIDSTHLSAYIRTTNSNNQIYIGSKGALSSSLSYLLNFTFVALHSSDNSVSPSTLVGQNGFFLTSRTPVGNNITRYENNTINASVSSPVGTKSPSSLYVGAYNNNSIIQFPSNNQNAFASIGDGLDAIQASNFYTAVQAFQTTLSRQV